MKNDFSEESKQAIAEAYKSDIEDLIIKFGSCYFECGYDNSGECYYNNNIAVAIAIIGKLYGNSLGGKNSNYHKGVAYIAKEAHLNKHEVKALRKQFRWRGQYVFKTSYKIHEIIKVMVDLLDEKKTEPIVTEYLKRQKETLYREILISEQFAAIRHASAGHQDQKVDKVRGELDAITKRAK